MADPSSIVAALQGKDIKLKLENITILESYLEKNFINDETMGSVMDAVLGCISDNNAKVCQGGLGALLSLGGQLGDTIKLYFNKMIPIIVDRLGDTKAPVRDRAIDVLLSLMRHAVTPSLLWDRLLPFFDHKLWRVKEQLLTLFCLTIDEYGPESVAFLPLLPAIVRCLDDQNPETRSAAFATLEKIYQFVGPALIDDLNGRGIRSSHLKTLYESFDTIDYDDSSLVSLTPASHTNHANPTTAMHGSSVRDDAGPTRRPSPKPSTALAPKKYVSALPPKNDNTNPNVPSAAPAIVPARLPANERDLLKEIDTISVRLKTEGTDWSLRVKDLQRLQSLIAGGLTTTDVFPEVLKLLKAGLVPQLSDLRSQVVKEACLTIASLSAHAGDLMDSIVDPLLKGLFKVVIVTIQVISQSGDHCVKSMIAAASSMLASKFILSMIDGCKQKNNMQRSRCSEYLLLCLERVTRRDLERNCGGGVLEDTVISCCSDAVGEVRQYARRCYCAIRHIDDDKARYIYMNVDSSTQQRLLDDFAKYTPQNTGNVTEPTPLPLTTMSGTGHPGGIRKSNSGSNIAAQGAPREERDLSMRTEKLGIMTDKLGMTFPPSPTSAMSGNMSGKGVSDKLSDTTHQRDRPLTQFNNQNSSMKPSVAAPVPKPVHVMQSNPPAEREGGVSAPSIIRRTPSAQSNGIVHSSTTLPPSSTSSTQGKAPDRFIEPSKDRFSPVDSTDASGAYASTKRGDQRGDQAAQRVSAPVRVPSSSSMPSSTASIMRSTSASSLPSSADQSSTSSNPPLSTVAPPPSRGDMDVFTVLQQCEHPDWQVRVDGYTNLSRIVNDQSRHYDTLSNIDRIAAIFVDTGPGGSSSSAVTPRPIGLTDVHQKVTQTALQALIDTIKTYPQQLEPFLEKILIRLFQRLSDTKEQLRSLAGTAIDAILEHYSADTLLPICLRALDNPSVKIRASCLELLVSIIPVAAAYLSSTAHVRQCVQKVVSFAVDKNPDLRELSLVLLADLCRAKSDVFFGQLLLVPLPVQMSVKKQLSVQIPDIDNQFSTYIRQRKESTKGGGNDVVALGPPSAPSIHTLTRRPSKESLPPPSSTSSIPPSTISAPVASASTSTGGYAVRSSYAPPPPPTTTTHPLTSMTDDRGQAFSTLLGQMNSASVNVRKDSLQKILRLCRGDDASSWSRHFGQLLLLVLEALKDGDATIRELSLIVIKEMIAVQPMLFIEFIEVVMIKLLECYRDVVREVCQAAEEALDLLISVLNPLRCMEVLIPVISSEDGPVLQAAIRILSKLTPKLPPVSLLDRVPAMMPGLLEAFKNANADIRKAVVFCLVDIYMILEDDFTPYLAELNTSQLKLVTIYINRAQQARDDKGGTPATRTGNNALRV